MNFNFLKRQSAEDGSGAGKFDQTHVLLIETHLVGCGLKLLLFLLTERFLTVFCVLYCFINFVTLYCGDLV